MSDDVYCIQILDILEVTSILHNRFLHVHVRVKVYIHVSI